MEKSRLWTKDFIINTGTNFLIYLGYYILIVIIVDYATEHLQASQSEAGLVSGLFILAGISSRIISGKVIEIVGRKKLLTVGIIIFSIATLLYFKADNLIVLCFVRVIQGIGWGIATTSTATIVAYIIPNERRGEGIGYYSLSVTIASAIGPLIGINMYKYAGFYAILELCVILIVISFISLLFLKVPKTELTKEELEKMKEFKLNNFFEIKVLPIAAIGMIVFLSYSSIISFLSSYVKTINLVTAGSFFFFVYSISILISRPLTGRLFDIKGEKFVMYPSFLLFAIGLMIISQAHNGFTLLLSAVFMGLGFGTFSAIGQVIAIKMCPNHRMGLATSTFLAIEEMGIGIGPYILGFVIPLVDFRGLYICMAGVVIVAMILYYLVYEWKVNSI